MLKQDVPSSPRAYELYLRANEMSRDTRQWQAALDLYEAVREGGSALRAGVGRHRAHAPDDWQVRGCRERRSASRKAEAALKRALELNPDLSAAEHLYAHLEVDLGRAEESMVRLLRRARERSADPELFAGLSHSPAATAGCCRPRSRPRSRRAGSIPKIRTSAGHTYFMLGDYERVLEYEPEDHYMRNLALLMLGRQRRGARVARRRGHAAAAPPGGLRERRCTSFIRNESATAWRASGS